MSPTSRIFALYENDCGAVESAHFHCSRVYAHWSKVAPEHFLRSSGSRWHQRHQRHQRHLVLVVLALELRGAWSAYCCAPLVWCWLLTSWYQQPKYHQLIVRRYRRHLVIPCRVTAQLTILVTQSRSYQSTNGLTNRVDTI